MIDRQKGWKCPAGSDRMRDELTPEIKYTVYNVITAVAIETLITIVHLYNYVHILLP